MLKFLTPLGSESCSCISVHNTTINGFYFWKKNVKVSTTSFICLIFSCITRSSSWMWMNGWICFKSKNSQTLNIRCAVYIFKMYIISPQCDSDDAGANCSLLLPFVSIHHPDSFFFFFSTDRHTHTVVLYISKNNRGSLQWIRPII